MGTRGVCLVAREVSRRFRGRIPSRGRDRGVMTATRDEDPNGVGGWPPPESRPAARAPGPRGRGVGCVPQADIGAFGRLKEIISGVPKPVLYQSDIDLALTFHGSEPQLASVLLERALGLADDLASQKSKRCVVMYDRAGKGVYEFTETLFGRYVRELTT